MKKNLVLFSLFIITLLLASCTNPLPFTTGPASSTAVMVTKTANSPSSTPTVKVNPGELRGVDIVFMYPWTGDVQKVVESLVDEFNKNNEWGIRVTTDAPGSASALADEVDKDLKNFAPPEVIAAPIDYLLRLNQSDQLVLNLTPYVESKDWGLSPEEISYFSDVFWQQDVVKGYRYGIPAQRTAKVMIYNKTWATELGFSEPPATPLKFEQQICDATGKMKLDNDETNDGLGGWIIDTDGLTIASWLEAFGTNYYTDGKIQFTSDQTISTLTYLRSLYDDDCAWLSSKPDPYGYFANRQTLIYSADLQDLFLQQRVQTLAGSKDEWEVLPFPSNSGSFVMAQGPSYAILSTDEKQNLAAWLFIRWMSNVDHQGKIIKASGTLPLGQKSVQYAIELEDTLPQWSQVAALLSYVKVPPSSADWTDARIILEDASWQLFRTDIKNSEIPDLVKTMDQTLKEIDTETP